MITLTLTVLAASVVGSLDCAGMCGSLVAFYSADPTAGGARYHYASRPTSPTTLADSRPTVGSVPGQGGSGPGSKAERLVDLSPSALALDSMVTYRHVFVSYTLTNKSSIASSEYRS